NPLKYLLPPPLPIDMASIITRINHLQYRRMAEQVRSIPNCTAPLNWGQVLRLFPCIALTSEPVQILCGAQHDLSAVSLVHPGMRETQRRWQKERTAHQR